MIALYSSSFCKVSSFNIVLDFWVASWDFSWQVSFLHPFLVHEPLQQAALEYVLEQLCQGYYSVYNLKLK